MYRQRYVCVCTFICMCVYTHIYIYYYFFLIWDFPSGHFWRSCLLCCDPGLFVSFANTTQAPECNFVVFSKGNEFWVLFPPLKCFSIVSNSPNPRVWEAGSQTACCDQNSLEEYSPVLKIHMHLFISLWHSPLHTTNIYCALLCATYSSRGWNPTERNTGANFSLFILMY